MHMADLNSKKINRRIAFRIYEQANLFYHKIDPIEVIEPHENFDNILDSFTLSQPTTQITPTPESIEQWLPDSQSQESDTLNVNISSSGIAFTSQNKLEAGDYLMIRMLLLSSMTVIMTCCKVVYCKPSNPYETDRYPYLIGAQFVNLTAEDAALLHSHISKRKKQQRIVNGFILSFALVVLAVPGLIFDLLLGFCHHVLGVLLHIIHLGFEFVEYNLDHLIEHTFHTELHTTQVIAFYTMLSLGLAGLYLVWRIVPPAWNRLVNHQLAFWTRKKASFLYYWSEQTLADKIKIIGFSLAAIAGYIYFGM